MSGEAVDATGKRRSRAEVSRLVEEYLRSGLSLKAFCQQYNLDRSTLTRPGLPGQRQSPTAQNPPSPGWVCVELASEPDPVSVGAPSGVAQVVAGGRRIELARNFDAATLHQLLHLLGSWRACSLGPPPPASPWSWAPPTCAKASMASTRWSRSSWSWTR